MDLPGLFETVSSHTDAPYNGGTNLINLKGYAFNFGCHSTRTPGDSAVNYYVYSNGTINVSQFYGVGNTGRLVGGSADYQYPVTGIFDDVDVNCLSSLVFVYRHNSSTNIFRHGASLSVAISGSTVTLFSGKYANKKLTTPRSAAIFSSGSRFYVTQLVTIDMDGISKDSATTLADVMASNPDNELRFTGEGTSFDVGTVNLGTYMPRQRLVLDDRATGIARGSGLKIGSRSQDGYCGIGTELQILNGASFTNCAGLTIGTGKGANSCKCLVRDATLTCKNESGTPYNIYVNYMSNNSELELDGATVNAQAILFGFNSYQDTRACTGGVLKVKGSCNFSLTAANPILFYTSGNKVYFDDTTVNFSNKRDLTWDVNNSSTTNNRVYIGNNSTIKFTNVFMGRRGTSATDKSANCVSGVVEIADSTLELRGQFQQSGSFGRLVVDNSTVTVGANDLAFALSASNGTYTAHNVADNTLVLKGQAPRINCTNADAILALNNSAVEFDMSEAPVLGYAASPLRAATVTMSESGTLAIGGLDDLVARMRTANVARTSFTLAQAGSSAGNAIPDSVIAATQAILPKFCRICKKDSELVLKVVASQTGLVLVFR